MLAVVAQIHGKKLLIKSSSSRASCWEHDKCDVCFECWCSRAVELCRSRASMWWITKRNRAAAWGSQKYVRDMQSNWSDKGVHQGSESLFICSGDGKVDRGWARVSVDWCLQMTLICSGEVEVSSGEKRNENQKQDGIHVSEWEEDRFKYLGSGY